MGRGRVGVSCPMGLGFPSESPNPNSLGGFAEIRSFPPRPLFGRCKTGLCPRTLLHRPVCVATAVRNGCCYNVRRRAMVVYYETSGAVRKGLLIEETAGRPASQLEIRYRYELSTQSPFLTSNTFHRTRKKR